MNWVITILALSILIIIHEGGHYLCARATGMHVRRFSILGIGPVVARLFTYKGTEFVISAIPFGAYVHIAGMEPEDVDESKPPDRDPDRDLDPALPEHAEAPSTLYRNKSLAARFLAIAGGPIANYLAAIMIVVGIYATAGVNHPVAVQIESFGPASPAQAAGLQAGDTYVSVAGQSVRGYPESMRLNEVTAKRLGQTVDVTVERAGELVTIPVTLNAKAPALGTTLKQVGEYLPVPFTEAVTRGAAWPFQKTGQQLSGLWKIITREADGRLGGPVAIAKAIKGSADQGLLTLLLFSAFISTLLGMFNLLPLPALDGGRLVFLLFELVARRPANRRVEEWVHAVGMIGLLGLIGYATIGDVRGQNTPVWRETATQYRAKMAKARAEEANAATTADGAPARDPAPE